MDFELIRGQPRKCNTLHTSYQLFACSSFLFRPLNSGFPRLQSQRLECSPNHNLTRSEANIS